MRITIAVEGSKELCKSQVSQQVDDQLGANAPSGLKAAASSLIDAQPAQHMTGTIEADYRGQSCQMSATFNYHAASEVNVPVPDHVAAERKKHEDAQAKEMKETGRKQGQEVAKRT